MTTFGSIGAIADDKPYANFAALAAALSARGRKLRFAMNAGMFGDDFAPVGLYVENGKRLRRADTRAGPTNFHLLPNGVFWVGDGVAGVEETSRFLADAPAAKFATQSGPMLVIDGHIHPKILPTGASQKVRNGVCVRDGVTAIFAISDEPVTFHAFARLFRDGLGCANALFLDGSVSSLYAPELGRDDELAAARTDDRHQRPGSAALAASGGLTSPEPSARCISGTSTQRPNLKPTERRTPTGAKPKRAMQRQRAGVVAVADHRHQLPPRPAFAAGDQFAEQRRAVSRARPGPARHRPNLRAYGDRRGAGDRGRRSNSRRFRRRPRRRDRARRNRRPCGGAPAISSRPGAVSSNVARLLAT